MNLVKQGTTKAGLPVTWLFLVVTSQHFVVVGDNTYEHTSPLEALKAFNAACA